MKSYWGHWNWKAANRLVYSLAGGCVVVALAVTPALAQRRGGGGGNQGGGGAHVGGGGGGQYGGGGMRMAAPGGGGQVHVPSAGAQFHAPAVSGQQSFHTPAVSGQSNIHTPGVNAGVHTPGVTAGTHTPGITAGAAVPHINAAPNANPTIAGSAAAGANTAAGVNTGIGANTGINAGAHTALRPTFGAGNTAANVGPNATANNFRTNWHNAQAGQLQNVHTGLRSALQANTAALRANTAAATAANGAANLSAGANAANTAANVNGAANVAGFTNPARANFWSNIGTGLTNSMLYGNAYGPYGAYGAGGYGLYGGYPYYGGNFFSGRNLIGMGVMSALGGGYGGYGGLGGYGGVGGYGGLGNWWGYSPWMSSYPAGYWYGNPGWNSFANSYGNPYFYDYGPGGNVVYSGNQVLVNDQPVATASEYAQSAAELATVTEDQMKAPHDWVPLGTFSVATGTDDKTPTRVAQVAYDNKQGLISGTMFNSKSGNLYTLQGKVDPQTQRVAFTVGNDPNTVFETGLYNLTQNASPVLLHMGPTQTQTWVFARLPEPKEDQATATAAAQPNAPTAPPAVDVRRE